MRSLDDRIRHWNEKLEKHLKFSERRLLAEGRIRETLQKLYNKQHNHTTGTTNALSLEMKG